MSNLTDIIINLKYTINKSLSDFNDLIFKRDRQIDFNSVFLFICKYNSINTNSYSSSISSLIIDGVIPNVSKTAFISKLKLIDYTYFVKLNDIVLKYFYNDIIKNNNKTRFLAVDGSTVYFKKLFTDEFNLSKNKNYTTGNLSCLFDIDHCIPVNYLLSKSFNERDLLIEQLSYVNNNDVIIADRGYYSIELINKIIVMNSNFILRVTKKNYFISFIKDNEPSTVFNYNYKGKIYKFKIYKYNSFNKPTLTVNDIAKINKNINVNKKAINKIEKKIIDCSINHQNLIDNKNKINISNDTDKIKKEKLKLIKTSIKDNTTNKKKLLNDLNEIKKKNSENYEKIKNNNIENEPYYLLTSCYKMSNDELKKVYQKRWGVETNFRFLKSNFKFDKLNSLNINTVKQNLYSCQFLFIIESLLNYISPNQLINIENIFNDVLKKTKNDKLIKKNITDDNTLNVIKNDDTKNILINDNIKNMNTNKSVSFNLIGEHLLKKIIITKIKKKERNMLYNKKNNKKNNTLMTLLKSTLTEIILIINEIIKNKIDHVKINKNNVKNQKNKKRINRRPIVKFL